MESDEPPKGGFGSLGGSPAASMDSPQSKKGQWWKEAISSPLSMGSTAVNLVDTLPYMEGRKSLRRFRGAYMKNRPLLTVVLYLILIALWAYRSSIVTSQSVSATFALVIGVTASTRALYIVLLAVVLIYLLVSVRLMTQYNLAFGWVITAIFIALCLLDLLIINTQQNLVPFQPTIRDGLLGLFLLAQGLYVLTSWLLANTIPYLQMRGLLLVNVTLLAETSTTMDKGLQADIPTDPKFRAVPKTGLMASSTFTYVQVLLPIFQLCVRQKEHLSYCGEVDKDGRPHGYGLWSDSQWHGETLEGWWNHGIPISPFTARETGSGSGFVASRMGYVKCRADGLRQLFFLPQFEEITVGVASAECSVSGFFFRDYPVVRFMAEPFLPEEIARIEDMKEKKESLSNAGEPRDPVESLKTALQWVTKQIIPSAGDRDSSTVVITANKLRGLDASGFYLEGSNRPAAIETITLAAQKTSRQVDEEQPETCGPPDQIPSAQSMGKPFTGMINIRGWNSCYNEQGREAILYIHGYNSPVDWGVKTLGQLMALGNYPSHLKPFVFSWPTGQLYCFLAAKRASASVKTIEALISTLKALDLAGFKKLHILTHSMGARVLMAAIPQITGLVSRSRKGESSSEKPSAEEGLPACMDNGMEFSTITLLNPELGLTDFLRSGAVPLREMSPVVTIYGDLKDQALAGSAPWNSLDSVFFSGKAVKGQQNTKDDLPTFTDGLDEDDFCCCGTIPYERSLGKYIYSIKSPHGEPLDIDIIDTTFLEANIHDVRHNSFALNRDIVEDVRDVMTTRRRANERTRLEARGGNVYSFLIAPAHVVQFS